MLYILLLCVLARPAGSYRILNPGSTTPNGTYFQPFDRGFVGIYGDPSNFQRERINEGAFETSDQELLYEGVSPRQSCPGMVGPFSDGNFFCTAREYGYCDRRSGTCFCNTGYIGIDCTECSDSHFRIGQLCFPKRLCPNDCSGAGVCNFASGLCECFPHRTGLECENLLCTKHHPLCEACTNDQCLKCAAGYYLTLEDDVCGSCFNFDPRCAGCTREEGCTVCADSTLTSVRRSGYRSSDPALPEEENTREFGITLPFGTKSPESFADAEAYFVSSTADQPLKNASISCAQGLNDDESWQCSPFTTSHIVCGHYGVFTFVYPNYEISETTTSIRMQVRRTGGGFGHAQINYYIKHFTTNDSDLIATAPYTTLQRLSFEEGVIERSFLITILDDNIVEENEVFQVVLEVPEGGGSVGAQFRTNVTIIDDDAEKLSAKLTRSLQNTTLVKAGGAIATQVQAMAANGARLSTGGEQFFALVENDVSRWSSGQRNSLRRQANVTDDGAGTYTVTSGGIQEQGVYQLRIWHAFPSSIRGEYFYDGFFESLAVQRLDHQVNFTWGTGKLIPRGSDYISVRWSGAVMPPLSGNYRFKVEADDHARLWVAGDLLLDHWHEQYVNLEPSREVFLAAGRLVEIVMEYREVRGEARARLTWARGAGPMAVIPQDRLYSLFEIDRSPVLVTVASADTYAATTECTGEGLFGATALTQSHFSVCPRDRFGNLRDDDDEFYLSTQLFSASLELLTSDSGGVGAERVTPAHLYNPLTACFDFSYTPEIAGQYTLGVIYETARGDGAAQVAGSPFLLTVGPAGLSGPRSLVHGLPSPLYAEAGRCYSFTVVARDDAQNLLYSGGADLSAYMFRVDFHAAEEGASMPIDVPSAAPTRAPTPQPSTILANAHYTTSPPSDALQDVVREGTVADHGDGNYTVQLCPVIQGTYETHILVRGRGVSNQPHKVLSLYHSRLVPSGRGTYYGQYVADSPYYLQVSHTESSGITSTAEGAGLVGATVGVPVSFMVTLRDPFDNVMRTSTPAVTLSAKLDLSPGALVDIFDYRNGSYNVRYTPLLKGANLVSVFADSAQIRGSPFSVPVADGAASAAYSFASGAGLTAGRAGDVSYFSIYSLDLHGNRKTTYTDRYNFTVGGANNITGAAQACPSPPQAGHPVCDVDDAYGGHYWASFRPLLRGDIHISAFLVDAGATELTDTLVELSNSPFTALVLPSHPRAELTDLTGDLYDCVAGVTAQVRLQLRDYFSNKLTGGRAVEVALLGVGVDWGTPEPLPPHQGLPDQPYYRGFYSGYPTYYGLPLDHMDGTLSVDYTAQAAGQYVLRVAVAEAGLNATYFNSTSFGHLSDQDQRYPSFKQGLQGVPQNVRTAVSWTGDLGRRQDVRGALGEGSFEGRFLSRAEQNISLDMRGDVEAYMGNTGPTGAIERYKFRDEYWAATWTGMITPQYAEEYVFSFQIDSASTATLRVGGRGLEFNNSQPGLLVLNTTGQGAGGSGRYNFSDTLYREFEVRFVHTTGDAQLSLFWASPSTPYAPVPASAYSHWRNASHFNTTVHPAPLCAHCSTAVGAALTSARVAVRQSFWVYARDEFDSLLQEGGDVPTMLAIGRDGVAFRGLVTDYGNSTYLVEYYATQAGDFLMYVSIGCCALHPNVGYPGELQGMAGLLVQGAPFLLHVESAPLDPTRSVAVGEGLLGGRVGEPLEFNVLFRDLHNNPTTAEDASLSVRFVFVGASDQVLPLALASQYSPSLITTQYTFQRAGSFLMYVALAPGHGANASKPIVASPFQVEMHPGKAFAPLTVCRGVGLRQARANTSAGFEVQLYDSFNNNLVRGGDRLYARLGGDAAFQAPRRDVVPRCADTQNGRTVCTYTAADAGAHRLTLRLLNSSVARPGGLGLTASYYSSPTAATAPLASTATPTSLRVARIDTTVDFSWTGSMVPLDPLGASGASTTTSGGPLGSSVRWEGYLLSPRTDAFTLVVRSLYINASIFLDDELVFDSGGTGVSLPSALRLGAAYRIVVVASSDAAGAKSAQLRWSSASIQEHTIPQFFLYDSAAEVALSPFPVAVAA